MHPVAAANVEAQNWADKYYFLIRRLHSLSGLVPVGVFVCIHLLVNSTVLLAPHGSEFQKAVGKIHGLPALKIIEVFGIFLPLAFHAGVGFWIWLWGSRSNAMQYRYGSNIRYTIQRITGGIAFVFILIHVYQLHWLGEWFGGGAFRFEHGAASTLAARTTAQVIQSAGWVAPLYAVGVLATVFHLANGIWTSLITWGITIKPASQRASGYACAAFGIVLGVIGMAALIGFRSFDSTAALDPAAPTHAMAGSVHDGG